MGASALRLLETPTDLVEMTCDRHGTHVARSSCEETMRPLPIIDDLDHVSPAELRDRIEAFVSECITCNAGRVDSELGTKQAWMMLACFELRDAAIDNRTDTASLLRQFEACLLACILCADRCPQNRDGCRCAGACHDFAITAHARASAS